LAPFVIRLIAKEYRKVLDKFAEETSSMQSSSLAAEILYTRMGGIEAAVTSTAGH
jgi:nicotinamide phosphoribosyltransferase